MSRMHLSAYHAMPLRTPLAYTPTLSRMHLLCRHSSEVLLSDNVKRYPIDCTNKFIGVNITSIKSRAMHPQVRPSDYEHWGWADPLD